MSSEPLSPRSGIPVAMQIGGGTEMSKLKSLASAAALGFALLAFGPATSTAKAEPVHGHGSYYGHRHAGHYRPYYGRYVRYGYGYPYAYPYAYPYYPYVAPYRIVRVFVPLPFPHWVNQRVYAPYPY
jgi:hypothetical protein